MPGWTRMAPSRGDGVAPAGFFESGLNHPLFLREEFLRGVRFRFLALLAMAVVATSICRWRKSPFLA